MRQSPLKAIDRLALEQINRRLKSIRSSASQTKVGLGWIHYMRSAMGLTMKKLGERAGVSIPAIQKAELREQEGTISIKTLRQIAAAMDCELVYAFVPKYPVDKVVEQAAKAKAARLLQIADSHMDLENQKVKQQLEKRIARLAQTLIEKGDVW